MLQLKEGFLYSPCHLPILRTIAFASHHHEHSHTPRHKD